jgi:hypothetical protein
MAWGKAIRSAALAAGLLAALGVGGYLLFFATPEAPGAPVQQARQTLDELCAAQLNGKDAAGLALVGRDLLAKAQRQNEDPTYLYVLLEKSRALGLAAGEGPLALHATRLAAARFNLDGLSLYRDTLQQLANTQAPASLVVHQSVRQALVGIDQERYDQAAALADLAQRVARRSREGELMSQADMIALDTRRGRELLSSFPQTSADTRPALLAPQARYLLFYRRDREAGLAMLSISNDPLAPLADRERHLPDEPGTLVACAADWWSAAARASDVPAWRIRRHASDIYARALPHLMGVQRDLVEKRIGDARIDQLAAQGYGSGIGVEVIPDGQSPTTKSVCADVILPADDLPKSNYTVRCTGYVDAPVEGLYHFLFVAGTGAKLTIDGKTLVDDPAFYRRRNGDTFPQQLTAGLHELVTEVHVASGKPRLQLTWKRPGQKDFTPIPTSALYHEDD